MFFCIGGDDVFITCAIHTLLKDCIVSGYWLMVYHRIIFIVCLLLICCSLHAQTTDTVTSIPKKEVTDTVKKVAVPVRTDTTQDVITIDIDTVVKSKPKAGPASVVCCECKVEDMNTGEGIPFAIILFPHTTIGTAADLNGNFIFRLDKLPSDTLHIQALGYAPVNKILRKSQHEI